MHLTIVWTVQISQSAAQTYAALSSAKGVLSVSVRNAANVMGFFAVMVILALNRFFRVRVVRSIAVMAVTWHMVGFIVKNAQTTTVKIAKSRKA